MRGLHTHFDGEKWIIESPMTMTPIMIVRVANYLHKQFSEKIKTATKEQKLMMQRSLDCIKQGKIHVKVKPFDERIVYDATQK